MEGKTLSRGYGTTKENRTSAKKSESKEKGGGKELTATRWESRQAILQHRKIMLRNYAEALAERYPDNPIFEKPIALSPDEDDETLEAMLAEWETEPDWDAIARYETALKVAFSAPTVTIRRRSCGTFGRRSSRNGTGKGGGDGGSDGSNGDGDSDGDSQIKSNARAQARATTPEKRGDLTCFNLTL